MKFIEREREREIEIEKAYIQASTYSQKAYN
jgi:hypothetical protein